VLIRVSMLAPWGIRAMALSWLSPPGICKKRKLKFSAWAIKVESVVRKPEQPVNRLKATMLRMKGFIFVA
jgi:hypothetical protein